MNTFQVERAKVAKKVIRTTDGVFRVLTSQGRLFRLFRMIFFPPIFRIMFFLVKRINSARLFLFKHISQTGITYHKIGKPSFAQLFKKKSFVLLKGDRLPYLPYKMNGKHVNLQHDVDGKNFLLVIFYPVDYDDDKIILPKYTNRFLKLKEVHYTNETLNIYQSMRLKRGGYLLVRPDMYVSAFGKKIQSKAIMDSLWEAGINIS